ncbi:tail fiber assembly protein [Enterobacter cloacae complex sp. ECC445]|uniref:tail fiber assembly protein n=1 Tax=Enterobacter cloacae complex sp. ECC445 TaxID=2913213 RepID=UPI001F36239A|nr:tail fiber assembly protein [Enterobacter cloacae complex sp. ECC445]MCG0455978.1 tail fiber assembly protein [Enterobacter cloacae complex sp. ECC445]
MHSQLFSNKTRGFYPIKSLRYYKSVNALPDDLVRVSDSEHEKFVGAAPVNCAPGYNVESKQMEWVTITAPAITPEETLAVNRRELLSRQREAAVSAFPLQSAVDLGIATEEEKTHLEALKKYVVELTAVNLNAPDWPKNPECESV